VGVPLVMIGADTLTGSSDIAVRLPGLVEKYLALGGAGFPLVPQLSATPPPPLPTPTPAFAQTSPLPAESGASGNLLLRLVVLGALVVLGVVLRVFRGRGGVG
jgi:hypothetical protein